MFNPAPVELSEVLSPEWLTQALSRAYPGVKVAAVTVVETIVTMATKVRFTVDYASGASADTPRAFCVKGLFGDHVAMMRAARSSEAEIFFYRECVQHLTLRTARVVYAELAAEGAYGILIMRDEVAAGARFLNALTPYTPEQAASSLDQLAQMHAATWRGRQLERFPWLKSRVDNFIKSPVMSMAELQALMDGDRGEPLKREFRDAERITRGLASLRQRTAPEDECMVHGDCHAGNVFEDARGATLIDWQVVQRSSWAVDVAYHLGSSLSPEDREQSERQLLDTYLDRLRSLGVEPPERAKAWDEYRAHMAYGFYLWAITRKVIPAQTNELVRRLGLAVTSLGSFELLGV